MDYNFIEIEKKWRKHWADNKTFKAEEGSEKPKFYSLDMFPYPSGAGLHVGHPLGYIASDIYSRYKRLKGFNVLHPMGYDSFGLPAEQYAIQTGQHPAVTTKTNVARYREQLDKIGFSFDWDREVRTSSPEYYKWTQWIFKQIFDCWYNKTTDKAERIANLIATFEKEGNTTVNAEHDCEIEFTAEEWNAFDDKKKSDVLMNYRLTYLADSWVNWCPKLGTVLANDEIVNGVSERGGHPVEQKLMRQWSMRIKAYAERLLTGLEGLDWTDSIKDIQRNWIGKSVGASVKFGLSTPLENLAKTDSSNEKIRTSSVVEKPVIEVFTTRPDTIYGVSFMVLAPEHDLVDQITTEEYKNDIAEYKRVAGLKSERDRMSDVKNISGQFTGAYAIHPFSGEKIPVWIGDYVLASYGTGAVMAVPCGDQRDYDFAKHFDIEIKNIFKDVDISEQAYTEKSVVIANSDFLNDLKVKKAMKLAIYEIEQRGFGEGKTNYRLRDAVFSRQRYWGEPFPVFYDNGIPTMIEDEFLPIALPEVDKYLPTEDGEPPLGNADVWFWDKENNELVTKDRSSSGVEMNTMPGWAGSSWYFLRYMDPTNENEFVAKEKVDYWNNVDLYIGGAEHATGHLLYARFWTKFLNDLGYVPFDEPFQKMINQGMILGESALHPVVDFWIDYEVEVLSESEGYIKGSKTTYRTDGQFLPKKEELVQSNIFPDTTVLKYEKDEFTSIIAKQIKGAYWQKEIDVEVRIVNGSIAVTPQNKRIPVNCVDAKNQIMLEEIIGNEFFKNLFFFSNKNEDYVCFRETDKMSKSKLNVQTPDEIVDKYGADTLRMYEMFLGPLEQAKPWDTKGINGVHNFLRKLWRLMHDADNNVNVSEGEADKKALKTLHKTIKKLEDDLERFSFNTGVSAFMIAVNELTELKCNNKSVLADLVVLLSPYAPHIAEELWVKLGNEEGSISYAQFPEFNPDYLVEDSVKYPVSFNGKMRFIAELPNGLSKDEVEAQVMAMADTTKYLDGATPKKVIVVPGKIVNIVK